MRDKIARGEQMPMPGLYRGKDGIYAIHFFAYPSLAAPPFRLQIGLCGRRRALVAFVCFSFIQSCACILPQCTMLSS